MQRGDQVPAPARDTGGGGHRRHGADDFVQGRGVERQHGGRAAQAVEGVGDVARRDRAHPAQVLGQDQIGLQGADGGLIEPVERLPRRPPRAATAPSTSAAE